MKKKLTLIFRSIMKLDVVVQVRVLSEGYLIGDRLYCKDQDAVVEAIRTQVLEVYPKVTKE